MGRKKRKRTKQGGRRQGQEDTRTNKSKIASDEDRGWKD